MPSTAELIRFQNSVNKMSPQARTQFFSETITWLETEERGKLKSTEESAFATFLADLQDGKTAALDVHWYHQLFIKNKQNGYFVRFLQRIR